MIYPETTEWKSEEDGEHVVLYGIPLASDRDLKTMVLSLTRLEAIWFMRGLAQAIGTAMMDQQRAEDKRLIREYKEQKDNT